MIEPTLENAPTSERLPVAPSMAPALELAKMPSRVALIDIGTVYLCAASIFVGVISGLAARLLIMLIALITNISFYGQFTFHGSPDARHNHLGAWVILVPAVGAFIIGLIARFGSRDVAGHGIPEAMERVLSHESRIPARMTFLKPLSAAISIGTGGPFGPEGPIIATGGALGSLVGQILPTNTSQRKILLAAGASAGISAAFNCPIAAVLLAVELLLFEFRPRSIIPVAFASAAAAMVRVCFEGSGPAFPFTGAHLLAPGFAALGAYTLLGAFIGIGAIILTRGVFAVEEFVAHLPIHWIFPLVAGAVIVGIIGYFDSSIFGAGYFNLDWLLSGQVALKAAAILCLLKFLAWTISLGSGTSGGTLAPVFTIGGSLAVLLVLMVQRWIPNLIDIRVAALVGMVAIFAGSSRALLTSVIFAFEVTREPNAVLPVICGCATAYVISTLLMRESIMTGKMAQQGVRVPAEYAADTSAQRLVRHVMCATPIFWRTTQTLGEIRKWLETPTPEAQHQGYPVLDDRGEIAGVLTRRDIHDNRQPAQTPLSELLRRPPVLVYDDCSLRDAADHMVNHEIGRLPVTRRSAPLKVVGIITRGDLLRAQRNARMEDEVADEPVISWPRNGSRHAEHV